MEFNLEDPLASFKEQHNVSTISELFASESEHMPFPICLCNLKATDFRVSFRWEAISLILQFSCNLDPFVAYLAINYFDRFISMQEIPEREKQAKPWLLRLIVISCVSLASKMKNTPFSLSDFQKEGCFFEAQSQKMELLILGTLKWRMRSITPFSFLHFFISSAEFKDPSLQQAIEERSSEIIFNAHYGIELLEFKPSIIASSALVTASQLFPLQHSKLKASISACDYLDKEALSKCSKLMQEMVRVKANESIVDTSFSSTETPASVLERHIKRRRI